MYQLIIIGGGPGGVAAGVYAARKKIKTLLITESFGGQSFVSSGIENWVGTKLASGFDFSQMLEEHVRAQDGIEIITDDIVVSVAHLDSLDGGFKIKTREGKEFETKYALVTSGSRRRKLGVPGEAEFNAKGVAYCATCDAPIFRDKTVAVVGGGNAGMESVLDLIPYASHIYLLGRSDALRGDAVTREKILASDKVNVILRADTQRILGEQFVNGLEYKDTASGEIKKLDVQGVFVEIGAVPNAEFVKDLVNTNELGEIVVDHKTFRTSCAGLWAAGDVSDALYKQNNISAGDAVKAVLNIYETLQKS